MNDYREISDNNSRCQSSCGDGFPTRPISRRGMLTGSFAALASLSAARESSSLFAADAGHANSWNLYWGDIHNHNECGLAKGTFQRAIELARGHLDFWAATGHAWWHDMPDLPKGGRQMFLNGFERHRKYWPRTRELVQDVTDDNFCAILGYEWHSSAFGGPFECTCLASQVAHLIRH